MLDLSFVTPGCQSGKLLLLSPAAWKLQIKWKKALVQIKQEIKPGKRSLVVHHVTNHFKIQETIKYIKEFTLERNPTIVTCAKSHFPHQQFLKIISKHTQEKNPLHVQCALKHSLGQTIWRSIHKLTLERNPTIVLCARSHFLIYLTIKDIF